MPLDAAIGQVFVPYCPGGHHDHRFRHKQSSCGVVKLLFEARVQKARNGPSTQLIKATSCVERWNATLGCIFLQESSGFLIFPFRWHFFHRNQDSCSAVTFFYPLRNPVCTGPTYVPLKNKKCFTKNKNFRRTR